MGNITKIHALTRMIKLLKLFIVLGGTDMCVCVCVQVRLQARKHAVQNVATNILNIVAVFCPVVVQVVLNHLPKLVTYAACL